MPYLTIQEGYKDTGRFELPHGTVLIGSSSDANVCLSAHLGIASEHCRINFDGTHASIEDLGTFTGTFVNGKPLQAPRILKSQDTIQLGNVLIIFSDNDFLLSQSAAGTALSNESTLAFVQDTAKKICDNTAKVIKGKDDIIRHVVIALLSDGHILLEDVPGVGKTKLARALARSIRTDCSRIQFTPDMLPNDVTGINLYDESTRKFVFMPGPIFSNIVLADEINRGTPRVQAALLECMAEAAVTVDGSRHFLRKPFFVIATQNPLEFHGTYPLPEAQLDRFLMKLTLGYPPPDTESDILADQADDDPLTNLPPVIDASELLRCQALIQTVTVSQPFRDYVVAIVNATRTHEAFNYGCSTRAALALMRASQAQAAMEGRSYVMPRDARDLAVSVLSHRLPLKLQARSTWQSAADAVSDIIAHLPIEKWETLAAKSAQKKGRAE